MSIARKIAVGLIVSLFLMITLFQSVNSDSRGTERTEAASLADCAKDVNDRLAARFKPAAVAGITVEVTGRTATLTGAVNYTGTRTAAAK